MAAEGGKQRGFTALKLFVRVILPVMIAIGGAVLIILGHATVNDVSDAPSGSVFTQIPTDHDSVLTAMGVALIVVAIIVVMFDWLMRLNTADSSERKREEQAREYFTRTGRWPDERPRPNH
jgi:TRAP-type C4-dicarboxylate transport system permease small subunit